jgi:microcystin degradation protein MlrC
MSAPRAFVAGLVHETNSFSPIPTNMQSFAAETVHGAGAPYRPVAIDTMGYGQFATLCETNGIEVRAGLYALAAPSAPLQARDHAAFRAEILDDLRRALPVDRVFLFMHGAQIAQGCDDVEGDLVEAVRAVVGPRVPIALELDLHGNLTARMIENATFVVACLEYPHTDYPERTQHVYTLLDRAARGEIRPVTLAWRIPLLGIFRTTEGPMQAFVEKLRHAQAEPGMLTISAFHGFPLGDTVHTSASLIVTAERDHAADAQAIGDRLSVAFIDAALRAPKPRSVDEAFDEALACDRWPVVMADSGDNPGGGCAGDSTWLLQELLQRRVERAAFGMLWDPVAVDFAHRAGAGAQLRLRIGGKVSEMSGPPLDVDAEVMCVRSDVRQARFGQGEPLDPIGRSAWLRVQGVDVVIASERTQVWEPRCFTEHGIDLSASRLVVVKSSTHFVNGFKGVAGHVVFCDSPGSLCLDPRLIPYRQLRRPIYPLDTGFMPMATPLAPNAP